MKSIQYLALLRGINVGGNNIIKMNDLKACFENLRFRDVSTYIQSGNVLFKSDLKDKEKLTLKIEKELSEKFSYHSCVVVITADQLKRTIEEAPEGFGNEPEKFRYDVLFLKTPLIAETILNKIKEKEGVDKMTKGNEVLYFSRLISKASQSHLTKLIAIPEYKELTIRNWNTTTRLLEKIKT